MSKQTNKPVAEFKYGLTKACVWRNDTAQGVRHNVTFSRLFKKEGKWQETSSFGRDDLLLIAKLADTAHSYIFAQAEADSDSDE